MTAADIRPQRRSLTPWAAGAAALIALAVLLWAVLGGGRGSEPEEQPRAGSRRVRTVNAVQAVPLPPADPGALAALAGPGSVVTGEQPFYPGGVRPAATDERPSQTRTRRAPRRRIEQQARSDSPGYRVIGPQASETSAAPPPPAPSPPPEG